MKLILLIPLFLIWSVITACYVAEIGLSFLSNRRLAAAILIATPILMGLEIALPWIVPHRRVEDPSGIDDPNVKCMQCGQTIRENDTRCSQCGWSWQETQETNPTMPSNATSDSARSAESEAVQG